ncbi:MAG: hypothetical protein IIT58_12555 [Treponema sp.]|nr:hypothetical protein [Treponema sp.]
MEKCARIAVSGAEVARDARKSLEKRGGTVISSKNATEIGTQQLPFEDHQEEDNSF